MNAVCERDALPRARFRRTGRHPVLDVEIEGHVHPTHPGSAVRLNTRSSLVPRGVNGRRLALQAAVAVLDTVQEDA